MIGDLFSYPLSPGFKERTTSKEAAPMPADAALLRARVLACFERAGERGLTADQCGALLRIDKTAVRPRVSELVALKKLEPTERRGKNESGKSARIWRIKRGDE